MSSSLALFGGTPAVNEPTPHFSWPPLAGSTDQNVLDQLHNNSSASGGSAVSAEFERALEKYFGVRRALLTSSGTAALHSAYLAAGFRPGDEVIVPAYASVATVTPLLHLGAIPVLADSDQTGNVSVADVAARITSNTAAIVVTHRWGIPADLAALRELADFHGLALVEDGSQAHGAAVGDRKVGSFGDIAAFSMSGTKPLTGGQGGFILTNDDEMYYRLLLHGHGNNRYASEFPKTHALHRYAATGMGSSSRIHPLAAVIALDQLEQLDTYLAGRTDVAEYLSDELRGVPGVAVPEPTEGIQPAWYRMPLTYGPEELDGLPVERFYEALRAEGLSELCHPGSPPPLNILPLLQNPAPLFPYHPHLSRISYAPGQFLVAESLHLRTLTLPVWYQEEDVPLIRQYVAGLRKVSRHHRELQG